MKKCILMIAVSLLLPIMSFAQLAIGGTALIKSPNLLGQSVNESTLNVNQACFGGNIRFNSGWFQIDSLLMCATGNVNAITLFSDVGVGFDLSLLHLSVGVGPNFNLNFGQTPLFQSGMNAKVGADILINRVSVGISYIMALTYNDHVNIYTKSGLVGLQVLFRI